MSSASGAHHPPGDSSVDDGLVSALLPAGCTLVRAWTLESAHDLGLIRAALRRELARGAEPEPDLARIAHDLVLVATELATNALRHGIPPTTVRLLGEGDTYLLDVADHDVTTVPRIAGGRAPGHGGFGLQIARRLALDVGWYTTDATKHVWARLPAHGPTGPLDEPALVGGARAAG